MAFLGLLLGLSGCGGCNQSKSREKPDVSNIKAEVRLLRFDRDLRGFADKDFEVHRQEMMNTYGPFYDFYITQFINNAQPPGDTAPVKKELIQQFIADPYIRRLQDSIDKYFSDTKEIEEELSQSMKYFKYYFPQITIPQAIAVNSGFTLSAFTYDEQYLGIGLDMYLGDQNPDYDSAGIYQYMRHKMKKGYITRNSMEALYNLYFGEEQFSRGKTLLTAMAEKGKKMYFLSYVLPDAPDSLLLGFTAAQTLWCEQNEYEIWKFLNDKDILYKDDYMDQKRYLDEGPTTTGMPAEAPGNIGSWIGLQMVRKYVKEAGGKVPLSELILKYDPKTIAAKSKYRPSKSAF